MEKALRPYVNQFNAYLDAQGPSARGALRPEFRERIAFGRLIRDLEKPDGSIDFEKAAALCGDQFEQAMTKLAASPTLIAIPVQAMNVDLGFDALEAKTLVREQRIALSEQIRRLQVRRNAYQPPSRFPGPNWDPHRKVGEYTDLFRKLQRKDFSHFFEKARAAFSASADAELWSGFEDRLMATVFMSGALGAMTSDLDVDNLPSALASIVLDTSSDEMAKRVLSLALEQPARYLSRAEEANWFPLTPHAVDGLTSSDRNFIEGLVNEHRSAVQEMPVLTNLVRRLHHRSLFKQTNVINHSHLLDTILPLKEAFASNKKTLFIGKEYSRSAVLLQQLWREGEGVDIAYNHETRPASFERELQRRYGSQYDSTDTVLTEWLDKQEGELTEGFHIIDDGGEAISALLAKHPDLASRSTAVEQTRFGANKLRDKALPLPVANVAECAAKLTLESVFIGWSLSDEIVRQIEDWESLGIPRGKEVVLIGYGAVGRSTALCMRAMGFNVSVVDRGVAAREKAEREGFATPPRAEALAKADYVLSGTGSCAWSVEDFDALPDEAKLFSLSSSVVEFSVEDPRVLLQEASFCEELGGYHTLHDQIIPGGPRCVSTAHGTGVLTYLDKQFLIANALHPANFTGAPHAIRPEFIQLTIALLYLGSVVAKRAGPKSTGLISLNDDPLARAEQRQIASDFMDRFRKMPSTEVPLFIRQMAEEAYQELIERLK